MRPPSIKGACRPAGVGRSRDDQDDAKPDRGGPEAGVVVDARAEVVRTRMSREPVFVSFDARDERDVKRLTAQVKDERLAFTYRDYPAGEPPSPDLREKIRRKVSQTRAVIVVVGEWTHQSTVVDWEIKAAQALNMKILVARLCPDAGHSLPSALMGVNVVDWDVEMICRELS